MSKIITNKPLLVMMYGYPGSGKTYFARQLCEYLQAAHLSGDRIRHELFEKPRYDQQENNIIVHLMEYMAEEFLRAGVSVVFDANTNRLAQRRALRDIARKAHSQSLLIWLQIDIESAALRISRRDRRKADDKYAIPLTKEAFNKEVKSMQNPNNEDYMVVSGKHTFNTQKSSVIRKLYDIGLINVDTASNNVIKPGMVNLVPKASPSSAGRVDESRRNITIR